MKQDVLSVVIPVYNGASFMGRQIESVLKQNYESVELILVNDGSTDDSLQRCCEYESKDSRVRVVNKKNGGESSARNAGIAASTGDYLIVIDQDDQLQPGMFADMMKYANAYSPDVVKCNFQTQVSGGTAITDHIACQTYDTLLDRSRIVAELLPYMVGVKFDEDRKLQGHWTAIAKMDMVRERGICYEEKLLKENDHRYLVDLFAYVQSAVLVEGCYYRWIKRAGSHTGDYSPRFDNICCNLAQYEDVLGGQLDFSSQEALRYNIELCLKDCIVYTMVHKADCNVDLELRYMMESPMVRKWVGQLEPYDDFTKALKTLFEKCDTSGAVRLAKRYYYQVRLGNLKRKVFGGA